MTGLEMKTETEAEDLGGELSDEALDKADGAFNIPNCIRVAAVSRSTRRASSWNPASLLF